MKSILFYIFFILFSHKLFGHGAIIVAGVEHSDGYIDLKIYIDDKSFLKEELSAETVRKKATKGETIVPLSKLHEGTIAVVVYHDEDNDGKLKTGFFWDPKEGFAFSNNYMPKGPPKFKKAAIELVHGESITIKLKY